MNRKLKLVGAIALSIGLASVGSSAARLRVQPGSGHPLNNVARSNFDIVDNNTVEVTGATQRVWVTHGDVPSGVTSVSAEVSGFAGIGSGVSTHRLCEYDTSGWTGCTTWTSTLAGVSVLPSRTIDVDFGVVHVQSSMANGGYVESVAFIY